MMTDLLLVDEKLVCPSMNFNKPYILLTGITFMFERNKSDR